MTDPNRSPSADAAIAVEYAALRSGCALLDAGLRAFARITGEDRTSFLQGMVSNDIAKLAPGDGAAAAILTVQGRVVTDLRVFVLEEAILLDFPSSHAELGVATLEKYVVADDVEFVDPEQAPLAILEGPGAAVVVGKAFSADVDGLARGAHRPLALDGGAGRIFAVTHAGAEGFLVAGPAALADAVRERVLAAGAVPVGPEVLEIGRVEAGIPRIGVDMDESNLAPEVGLADAISHSKGCYIGQEVVERVASRGNVQKKLVGLRLDLDHPVPAGTALKAEEKEAGVVTSCVASPTLGVIALAYARRSVWDPGARVIVVAPDGDAEATVEVLPFVRAEAAVA